MTIHNRPYRYKIFYYFALPSFEIRLPNDTVLVDEPKFKSNENLIKI